LNCNLVNGGASRRSDAQPANATSDASAGKSTTAPASTSVVVAPAASATTPPTPPAPVSSSSVAKKKSSAFDDKSKKIIKTVILKSEYGIGLDLVKTPDGGVAVQRLKDMPDGSPNPASICNPPVLVGDIIVGVNDQRFTQFADVVKAIRGCNLRVGLMLERANG